MPNSPHQAGAYAGCVTVPARRSLQSRRHLITSRPRPFRWRTSSPGQVLADTVDVRAGQRVLVHAAAGGVGHLPVQIAESRGAHVVGTARAKNHRLLRSLGADELVDYVEGPFEDAVAAVDVVLDTIGGDYAARSLDTLRRGGILVCLASPFDPTAGVVEEATPRGLRTSSPSSSPTASR
jgi:NADPH:quinone reductase-like Zn-dependent oxidoreductase